MKFYNPFKLHIVYNETLHKYAARKLNCAFGWLYLDVSAVYMSARSEQFFWNSKENVRDYCYGTYDRVMEIAKEYKQPTSKDKFYKTL